ncbi:hypothetical protein H9P43_008369 [Blastocladiella emersonii ATCC 22665]|nr:hypothetical protein H9P43_008369 [Blastocladiella emersonii ATCC 22665]
MVAPATTPAAAPKEIVLFAVDDSGSTGHASAYWTRVGERFNAYKEEHGEMLHVLRWDMTEVETTHAQLDDNIRRMNSRGGTDPTCVARYISRHRDRFAVTKLCIITDGQIDPGSVQRCDRELAAIPGGVPDVEACLFGNYSVDLSVVAPFARSANFVIRHNDAVLAEGCACVAVEDSDLLEGIRTPQDLFDAYEALHQLVVVQNLGRANPRLRDELIKLQKRLLDVIARENARKIAEAEPATAAAAGAATAHPHPILDPLRDGDFAAAVTATRDLLYGIAETADDAKKVGDCITKLVQACTVASFRLDTLQSHRATRAALATVPESEVPTTDVDPDAGAGNSRFECPIMLDDDATPVLLIAEHASGDGSALGVLEGADTAVIDDVTDCPLNLLKYPALVDRLVDRIDHAIGAAAFTGIYHEATAGGAYRWSDVVSPFTRRPLVGCIPLGTAAQHVKLGTWVVRQLATRGVQLGNAHLWLATVYLAIRARVPRLAENDAFMRAFRAHLVYRFEHPNYATNIALSGLPGYPMLKAPVAAALWYSLTGATQIFATDAEQFAQERLRQWFPIAAHLRHLVEDVLQYPVVPPTDPAEAAGPVAGLDVLDERVRVLRVFGYLMSRKQDLAGLKLDIARLYQSHLVIPYDADDVDMIHYDGGERDAVAAAKAEETPAPLVVLVDGPATPAQIAASPAAWLLDILPLPRIMGLLKLVDAGKKVGSILLDPATLRRGAAPPTAVTLYGYTVPVAETGGPTPICPATLRPWTVDYRDAAAGEHWTDRAARVHGAPVAEQLSAYNMFLEFVIARAAYPKSIAELVAFYAQRQAGRLAGAKVTLPKEVDAMAREVIQSYKTAFKARGGVPAPAEFVKIIEASRPRDVRAEIEAAARVTASAV